MMISLAPWQKIQLYVTAFGARHLDFAAAFDNVRASIEGTPRQIVYDGYIDPPVAE